MPGHKAMDDLQAMRRERDRYVSFAFAASDLLVELDMEGKIVEASSVSPRFAHLTGSKVRGQSVFKFIPKDNRDYALLYFSDLKRDRRVLPVVVPIQVANNEPAQMLMSSMILGGRIFLSLRDVDQLVAIFNDNPTRDSETGLLDVKSFQRRAELLAETADEEDRVTMFSLDGLAEKIGARDEKEAEEFMNRLGAILRSQSVGGDMAVKLSDDRFGVIADKPIDEAPINELVNDFLGDKEVEVKRLDLALHDGQLDQDDAHRALVFALNEFAAARDVEGLSFISLSDAAKARFDEAKNKVASIRSLVQNATLVLAFQPIVSLQTYQLHHYEALSRLETGNPQDTFRLAEQTGLAHELDLVVLKKLLELLHQELRAGFKVKVAMNLSAHSLQSNMFVAEMNRVLKAAGNVRHGLSFEITETGKIDQLETFDNVIQELRTDGHSIALDDVGTGTTSFETLRRVRVDHAKLDGQYVRRLFQDERDKALVLSVVNLCNAMGSSIVAEMIEEVVQVEELRRIGVDLGQGYLFGRPVNGSQGLRWQLPSTLKAPIAKRA